LKKNNFYRLNFWLFLYTLTVSNKHRSKPPSWKCCWNVSCNELYLCIYIYGDFNIIINEPIRTPYDIIVYYCNRCIDKYQMSSILIFKNVIYVKKCSAIMSKSKFQIIIIIQKELLFSKYYIVKRLLIFKDKIILYIFLSKLRSSDNILNYLDFFTLFKECHFVTIWTTFSKWEPTGFTVNY